MDLVTIFLETLGRTDRELKNEVKRLKSDPQASNLPKFLSLHKKYLSEYAQYRALFELEQPFKCPPTSSLSYKVNFTFTNLEVKFLHMQHPKISEFAFCSLRYNSTIYTTDIIEIREDMNGDKVINFRGNFRFTNLEDNFVIYLKIYMLKTKIEFNKFELEDCNFKVFSFYEIRKCDVCIPGTICDTPFIRRDCSVSLGNVFINSLKLLKTFSYRVFFKILGQTFGWADLICHINGNKLEFWTTDLERQKFSFDLSLIRVMNPSMVVWRAINYTLALDVADEEEFENNPFQINFKVLLINFKNNHEFQSFQEYFLGAYRTLGQWGLLKLFNNNTFESDFVKLRHIY